MDAITAKVLQKENKDHRVKQIRQALKFKRKFILTALAGALPFGKAARLLVRTGVWTVLKVYLSNLLKKRPAAVDSLIFG